MKMEKIGNVVMNYDYYIHLDGVPTGYTYDPNAYTTSATNKNVTITLIQLNDALTGEGTKANPHVLTEGASTLTVTANSTEGAKYYSFTPTVSGKYSFKSIAMDKLNTNPVTLYLYKLASAEAENGTLVGKTNNVDVNFSYEFTAEAGTTYYFYIINSNDTTKYPVTFDVVLTTSLPTLSTFVSLFKIVDEPSVFKVFFSLIAST